jgi:hypothetical protein
VGQAQIPSSCPRVTREGVTVNATSRWAGGLLLLFLHRDVGDAFIRAAVEAEAMRLAQRAALRALHEVHRRQRVMGASSIAAAFGEFAFWLRCHRDTPSMVIRSGSTVPPDWPSAGQAPARSCSFLRSGSAHTLSRDHGNPPGKPGASARRPAHPGATLRSSRGCDARRSRAHGHPLRV